MQWEKVSVRTSHEAMEIVASFLEDLGAAGTEIDDPALLNAYIRSGQWDYTDLQEREDTKTVTVSAYLAVDESLPTKITTLRQRLDAMTDVPKGSTEITRQTVADEDWAETWKQYFHVEKVGQRLVIRPTWENYQPQGDELVITLDPGAAFGTGQHATTMLCLRALEKMIHTGMRVFDVGTGSGVLSIAAALLGAQEVHAYDFDPVAVRVAQENVQANHLTSQITVEVADLLAKAQGKADVICANIIAGVILRLLPEAPKYLRAGGYLLLSGIIADRVQEVQTKAEACGFTIEKRIMAKDWALLIVRLGANR